MRKISEVLRLKAAGMSVREIARAAGAGRSTVFDYLLRADAAGLSWPLPAEMDEGALEAALFPAQTAEVRAARPVPDWKKVHAELASRKHLTLRLLWLEWRAEHPDGCTRAQVFVATLGCSGMIYAEVAASQSLENWLAAHSRAFSFYGGVPVAVTPDNLKAGVTKACYYDPVLNASYAELASHFHTVVLPARPDHPRDKAAVENAVLQVERWVLAPLRHRQFFSLAEANKAVAAKVAEVNGRAFRGEATSRAELFATLEAPALGPLPAEAFELAVWKKGRVNIDYHLLTELVAGKYLLDHSILIGHVLDSSTMGDGVDGQEPAATMVVGRVGRLVATGDSLDPYQLIGPDGVVVEPVTAFLRDLLASGRSPATLRSYGMDLLRWFRFCWAVGVGWDRAGRGEAREFSILLQVAPQPSRPHWRTAGNIASSGAGASPKGPYSPSVRAHSETVLRSFYDFHRDAGTGPLLNPFPLGRRSPGRRSHAHHNPMEPLRNERVGLYRPRLPARIPRSIPDEQFNEIFARLASNRDRALVAFYVSSGARASKLLSVTRAKVDPGRQVISVVRKGSRAIQELPASPDAFVWLRLYEVEMEGLVPPGRRQPLFWTLRRPFRPLTYHAAHRMFERVNEAVGASATLHALRHTAAYRMAQDPTLPLTDVQFVLGHAQLSTTQLYLTPRKEDVIRRVLAHYEARSRAAEHSPPPPAPGYRPESLAVLFGQDRP